MRTSVPIIEINVLLFWGALELLYNDRKMMKWQGFLLSEHAEQLKKVKAERRRVILDEQAKELFDWMIHVSYYSRLPLLVHLNTFGEPYIEVTGIVESLHHSSGYLTLKEQGSFSLEDVVEMEFAGRGY